MKLFYFGRKPYFEKIFDECKKLGIDNWEIVSQDAYEKRLQENAASNAKHPIIFSDEDQKWSKSNVTVEKNCTMGVLRFTYDRFREDVFKAINEDKDIIICLNLDIHDCFTMPRILQSKPYYMNDLDAVDWMVQETDKIHLIFIVEENFASNDYHELVNYVSLLTQIKVISISFVNICQDFLTSTRYTDEEIGKKLLMNLKALLSEKKELFSAGEQSTYLYDWEENKYKQHKFRRKDICMKGFDLPVDLAASDGKAMCKMLKKWRKEYALKNNIAYEPKECNFSSVCHGSCPACEQEARILYQNYYDIRKKLNFNVSADICALSRLRYNTDGKGLRTLVMFNKCNLKCRYCVNKSIINAKIKYRNLIPLALVFFYLYNDMLYFSIDGGVTFGGGEPLLYADFIHAFHSMLPEMSIDVETSLNASRENVDKIIDDVDEWFIDIKDMNREIYQRYTGFSNDLVKANLEYLISKVDKEKIKVRVPNIAGYNTPADVEKSVSELKKMGAVNIEVFDYKLFK